MYNKAAPVVDSVRVNPRDVYNVFIFHNVSIFKYPGFWKSYYVKIDISWLIKYFRSSNFLFKEQVLMWNRSRQLFLLGIFIDWTSSVS